MTRSLLPFLLLLLVTWACDEQCIQDCIAEEDPEPGCFAQCSCDSPIRSRPFGHKFETESGEKYEIRDLAYTEYDWVEKYYGCDVTCATLCFGGSTGSELVDCFRLCGCEELLRPQNQEAVRAVAKARAVGTGGAVMSAACADVCEQGCMKDPEDSFSKCFTSCTRKLCALPVSSPGLSPSFLPHPVVYLFVSAGLVGVYYYLKTGTRHQLAYKSL